MATDELTPRTSARRRRTPPAPPTSRWSGRSCSGRRVLVVALTAHFGVGLALVVLVALVAAAFFSGLRSFVHVFLFACVLRPLIDLAAGPRGDGISVTELFGVAVLAVMGGWLLLHLAELRPRLLRPLPLSLLALVLVQALATVGSSAPAEGLATTLRLSAGVAAFLVTDLLLVTGRLSVPPGRAAAAHGERDPAALPAAGARRRDRDDPEGRRRGAQVGLLPLQQLRLLPGAALRARHRVGAAVLGGRAAGGGGLHRASSATS